MPLSKLNSNKSNDGESSSIRPTLIMGAIGILTLGIQHRQKLRQQFEKYGIITSSSTNGKLNEIVENSTCSDFSIHSNVSNDSLEPYIEKHPKGFGEMTLLPNIQIRETYLLPVPHLTDWLPAMHQHILNTRSIDDTHYNKLMTSEDIIIGDIRRNSTVSSKTRAYLRAGPRRECYFNPPDVKAAIVTCGGLCPGLNNVIRDITLSLWNLYGVREIYGIRGGFHGFYNWTNMREHEAPLMLNPDSVSGIHHWGGTILGSNRGGFDIEKILRFLIDNKISQLYIIGGDGTHRGANALAQAINERGLCISVAGVPKTIDNDVDLLDRSFGFNTAVEEAQRAIRSAKTEAKCVPNGIGIVKLMGRSAGFIAAHATLSSGDVNLCLVPEVPIVLSGPKNCLNHLERAVEERGHAVVVVAEGAGEELLQGTYNQQDVDAGGNKKLPPIGEFMKHQIQEHFQQVNKKVTVKYIDPSYMIRSVPANAADSLYCMLLAQNAVHGAMAGYTAFTVGLCANRVVYLPMTSVTLNSPRCMDPRGRTWERVLCMTRQPNTVDLQHISVKQVAISANPPL